MILGCWFVSSLHCPQYFEIAFSPVTQVTWSHSESLSLSHSPSFFPFILLSFLPSSFPSFPPSLLSYFPLSENIVLTHLFICHIYFGCFQSIKSSHKESISPTSKVFKRTYIGLKNVSRWIDPNIILYNDTLQNKCIKSPSSFFHFIYFGKKYYWI